MGEFETDKVIVLKTRSAVSLLTCLRNYETKQAEYARYADRYCTILAEEALAYVAEMAVVKTPCGIAEGLRYPPMSDIVLVSILRSGDILAEAFRKLCPDLRTGKILIQRDESDPEKRPKLYYSKLPEVNENTKVLLCDPMLATGGSVSMATEVLKNAGVNLEKMLFVSCISVPEGIKTYSSKYPEVQIITGCIDEKLNEDKFIVPGLGDFGDRYYGTTKP